MAVCVAAAWRGKHVIQIICVKDDAAGNLFQLGHGEALVGPRGDVDMAPTFGRATGQFENPAPGSPKGVNFGFPVISGAEDWRDGFYGNF